jgi:hypothetical protein
VRRRHGDHGFVKENRGGKGIEVPQGRLELSKYPRVTVMGPNQIGWKGILLDDHKKALSHKRKNSSSRSGDGACQVACPVDSKVTLDKELHYHHMKTRKSFPWRL